MTDIFGGTGRKSLFFVKDFIEAVRRVCTMDHNTRTNALATRTRGGDDA